jgi:NADP-dependent 3-hydroxy acid dehydrogenase YdfG
VLTSKQLQIISLNVSAKMSFPYKHVLLIGATSGIGRAMADRLAEDKVKVTAVGRRQERLDEFVRMHGEENATSAVCDLADVKAIPAFVERYRFTTTQNKKVVARC